MTKKYEKDFTLNVDENGVIFYICKYKTKEESTREIVLDLELDYGDKLLNAMKENDVAEVQKYKNQINLDYPQEKLEIFSNKVIDQIEKTIKTVLKEKKK